MQLLNAYGESAEEEVAGVGHDGAATRGDTIFCEKEKQVGEEFVDVMGALKLREFAGEDGTQVSGMRELGLSRGVAETEARARIDDAEALTESPALLAPVQGTRVTCWVGGSERSEFIRQNALLANIWTGLGAQTCKIEEPDRHHFNVVDGLSNPHHQIVEALLSDRR